MHTGKEWLTTWAIGKEGFREEVTGPEGSRLRASLSRGWDIEVTHPAESLGPDLDRRMDFPLRPHLIEVSSLSPEVGEREFAHLGNAHREAPHMLLCTSFFT